jgi:hypothetical protein
MKKIKITKKQYESLILLEQKNKIINEEINNIILPISLLMGYKLTGLNKYNAEKSLDNQHTLKMIKDTLEDENKVNELIKSLGDRGIKDADIKLSNKSLSLIKNFNDKCKSIKLDCELGLRTLNLLH